MSSLPSPGYIYLLVEREFVRSGEPVVKVGRTSDVIRRMSEYPKGSKLLFCIYCDSQIETEAEILRLLDASFKRRSDIGRESFEGDLNSMVSLVGGYSLIKFNRGRPACPAALGERGTPEAPPPPEMTEAVDATSTSTSTDAESTTSDANANSTKSRMEPGPEVGMGEVAPVVPPAKETMLADAAIVRFVEGDQAALHDAREVSVVLYERFVTFAESMNWKVPASHERFCSLLMQIYKARSVFERDGGNVCRYIQMPPLLPVVRVEVSANDPRHEFVRNVIDKVIDFSPPPRTVGDGLRGRKVAYYVERGRILEAVISADNDKSRGRERGTMTDGVKRCVLKDLIEAAMVARGRPMTGKTNIGGVQLRNSYNGCVWKGHE